jgi:LmbE family N-acetylglucosaminyl deacetylase
MRPLGTFLICVGVCAQTPHATQIQPAVSAHSLPIDRGAAALWQSLHNLHTRASLLMVTAHPDDEDGGMLTYESRGRGARVALLTLNRGEGGANVMSPDFFDALGLVRTEELLAAGRYYGVTQYWTRVVDYGFSKTMDESMQHWTRERVLRDVVRIVRTVRPLVITSVFVGGPSDGHGNHQTAGAMAQAVFRAAGDPNMFPDQIREGLRAWSPLKDYARVPFGFGRNANAPRLETNVEIPEGEYDPVLGASYVQISREGLGMQKSQNGGPDIPKAGPVNSAYHRFASAVDVPAKEKDFFDGIDVSLMGLAALAQGGDTSFVGAGLGRINAAVEDAIAKFSAPHPEQCASALAAGLKETISLLAAIERSGLTPDSKYNLQHEFRIKEAQFNNALVAALGLSLSAVVAPAQEPNPRMAQFLGDPETFRVAIPAQRFGVKLHAVQTGGSSATLRELSVKASHGPSWGNAVQASPPAGPVSDVTLSVSAPDTVPFTKPYFTRPNLEQSYYDMREEQFLGQPLAPYPLAGWAEWNYAGVTVRVGSVVQTVKRVTGQGTVLEPLVAGPAIGIEIAPRSGVVPLAAKAFELKTVIHSNVKGAAQGTVRLELPAGWTSQPASAEFKTEQDGEERTVAFSVTPGALSEKSYSITAVAEYGGRQYREGYELTGYAGLRPYPLYNSATHRTTGVDVKVAPGLKIGYISGSGDDVPAALENIGVKVEFLAPQDVTGADISKYDAIVLGVRAYAARAELATSNARLLDYVNKGGVVIVQYNTPEYDHNFGPYPYSMGNNPEEVTDETSKVNILVPTNPLFTWPNPITERDFAGWVEERGSKWLRSWDPRYEALLETHDAGQEPQKGGLLYARYGKGVYIYNAYAFYRQLPEGVPGAYRIFANMISLPKNPQLR